MNLKGDIRVSGAKNAALPIVCASILTADNLKLTNVPQLKDIFTLEKLLGGMGINAIESLRGNRGQLRGVDLNEMELRLLDIKHAGESW